MKPREISCALAAFAIGLCASGCADGDSIGVPVTRPLPPFGTEPAPVTGSEPTTGGNDPLPGQEVSLEELCSAACARGQSECPGAGGPDCVSGCTSSGLSLPSCASQFRAVLACIARAPLVCYGAGIQVRGCDETQAAFRSCAASTGS